MLVAPYFTSPAALQTHGNVHFLFLVAIQKHAKFTRFFTYGTRDDYSGAVLRLVRFETMATALETIGHVDVISAKDHVSEPLSQWYSSVYSHSKSPRMRDLVARVKNQIPAFAGISNVMF
jgi:hypothetical protein